MKKYRFKTEEEFEKEFGPNWKRNIQGCWNSNGEMDFLFEEEVSETHWKEVQRSSYIEIEGWHISKDMVIEEDIIPEFKNGVRIMENGLMTK